MQLADRLTVLLDRRPWLAPVLLALASIGLLMSRLNVPGEIIFDETYYVPDALSFLEHAVDKGFAVHPPVGKWGIAASIAAFGDNPVGWRASSALAGIVTVLLTYWLGRRLLSSVRHGRVLALLPPVLLLTDGLFITQSRIAMLDSFLLLFTTLGLLLLVVDHDRRDAEGPRARMRPSLRVLAGVALGLAIGVKWSGLLAIGAAGLLTIGWELAAAHASGRFWRDLPRRAAAVVGSLVLVPLAVYALTWAPWVAGFEHSYTATKTECSNAPVGVDAALDDGGEAGTSPSCRYDLATRLGGLATHHRDVARFHLGLEASHNYRGDPLGFPVLARPVVYHWETCSADRAAGVPTEDKDTGELVTPDPCVVDEGDAAELLAVGNPVLWWGFVLLTPLLVAGTVRRDRRSAVPLIGWAALWMPWLLVSRTAFLFYLVPAVPLLAIGVIVALTRLAEPTPRQAYIGAVGGALVAGGIAILASSFDGDFAWRTVALAAAGGWLLGAALVVWRAGSDPVAVVPDDDEPLEATLENDDSADDVPTVIDALDDADRRARRVLRVAVLTAVIAFVVFVWFAPVWLAVPLTDGAVRARWLFPSWI